MSQQQEDYRFINGSDYLSLKGDSETWLIEPLVPVGGWVNLYGKPKKARKSYLALGMAHAIASAQDQWLWFDLKSAGPVLYFQVDTPRNLWRDRLEHISLGGYDFSNVWFADPFSMPYPFDIMDQAYADTLAEMIENVVDITKTDPATIVLDTGRKLHTTNENDNGEMSQFMSQVESVTKGMSRLLVTHDNKFGAGGKDKEGREIEVDLMEGNRGASAVAGAMDTVMRLTINGRLDYQGRATAGEERRQLRFERVCPCTDPRCPGYLWFEDARSLEEAAQDMIAKYPKGDTTSLGRMLARACETTNEAGIEAIAKAKEQPKPKKKSSGNSDLDEMSLYTPTN